jgi:hypothetical protein
MRFSSKKDNHNCFVHLSGNYLAPFSKDTEGCLLLQLKCWSQHAAGYPYSSNPMTMHVQSYNFIALYDMSAEIQPLWKTDQKHIDSYEMYGLRETMISWTQK